MLQDRLVNDSHLWFSWSFRLSSPTLQPAAHSGFHGVSSQCGCLAGWREKMRSEHSGQGVTFYLFLMEKYPLTTLYVGGLATEPICHFDPISWKYHLMGWWCGDKFQRSKQTYSLFLIITLVHAGREN